MRIYFKKNLGWINIYIKWEFYIVLFFVFLVFNFKIGNLVGFGDIFGYYNVSFRK